MKAIVVMFDTLSRHFLPPYGNDWVHAPNFARLAERTVTFDTSYVCSMPCMPARRDWHTGRPNFLHRSWGPLEPFDDSMPKMLSNAGIHTHLTTDHNHYFEDGGLNYHTHYTTWTYWRGQEGDPWIADLNEPEIPARAFGKNGVYSDAETYAAYRRAFPEESAASMDRLRYLVRQDWVNRGFMNVEANQPQARTFRDGLNFIDRNAAHDDWMLHIETFDPHEPFYTQDHYKRLYAELYDSYDGAFFDWPMYARSTDHPEETKHLRVQYAALVSMCDHYLGQVLDAMDRHALWDDTMLVVWTDHGFLLGEHDWWGKMSMPIYQEIAHTPFFVWDPRSRKRGERRQALVQPSIDLAPTLLRFFGQEPTADMTGHDLGPAGHDHAARSPDLGDGDRILVAAMIEGPHDPRHRRRRLAEVEHRHGSGPRPPTEVAAPLQVLWHRRHRVVHELPGQLLERCQPGLETAGIERERGVVGRDREALLRQDGAGVGLGPYARLSRMGR